MVRSSRGNRLSDFALLRRFELADLKEELIYVPDIVLPSIVKNERKKERKSSTSRDDSLFDLSIETLGLRGFSRNLKI